MPSLAENILRKKAAGKSDMNLQGVMLGDAFISPMIQRNMKPTQAHWAGLMGRLQIDQIHTIEALCIRHIQTGNTNQLHSACEDLKSFMLLAAGIVNVYDVRKFVPSTNKVLIDHYLNRPETREALHVPDEKPIFKTNAKEDVYVELKYDILRSVKHLIPLLTKHIRVLLYNGNFDLQDGPIGTEQLLYSVESEIPGIRTAPRHLWFFDNKVAGYELVVNDRLTFLTVHGAGHFVPTDQPKTALEMLRKFLYNKPFCKKGESVPLTFTTLTPDEFKQFLDVDSDGVFRVPCEINNVLCKRILKNCNGNGECVNGNCVCKDGFTGEDCSRRISLLKPHTIQAVKELQPQEWIYFKVDTIVGTQITGKLQYANITAIPDMDRVHYRSHEYYVGEGIGGIQPFGSVCVYTKKGRLPGYIRFNTVQCFDAEGNHRFMSELSQQPTIDNTHYIGIFNSQPYSVTVQFEYQIDSDKAEKIPSSFSNSFQVEEPIISISGDFEKEEHEVPADE
jgi:hypothetical protein